MLIIMLILLVVAITVFDVWLDKTDRYTISQRINALLPKWADVVIVAIGLILIGYFYLLIDVLYAAGLILIGHLLLGHERYGKISWKEIFSLKKNK